MDKTKRQRKREADKQTNIERNQKESWLQQTTVDKGIVKRETRRM